MGTQDHTKLLFRQFNALSKVKIVGFVNFFNKTDFSSDDKININNIKIKNIHKTRFDEILVSSYEYNFEIIKFLYKLKSKKYSIYNNTSRSFINIFKNNLLFKLKNNKF